MITSVTEQTTRPQGDTAADSSEVSLGSYVSGLRRAWLRDQRAGSTEPRMTKRPAARRCHGAAVRRPRPATLALVPPTTPPVRPASSRPSVPVRVPLGMTGRTRRAA